MRGCDRRVALAALGLLVAGNATDPAIETGRAIFQRGIGRDPIAVELFGQRVANPSTFSCAACHGEYGTGGSEGGIVAPALIVADGIPDSALDQWLARALDGRGAATSAARRMPHYTISPRDRAALARYLRTFPNPPVQGLTPGQLTVGLETTGMGLDAAGRSALVREISDQFATYPGYGLFGRRLAVQDVTGRTGPADVFAAIVWDPRSTIDAPVRLSVRPPVTDGADPICASIQPSSAEQYRILTAYLDRRGLRYRTVRPADGRRLDIAVQDAPDRGQGTPVDVVIDLDGESAGEESKPRYLFADLVGRSALRRLSDNVHLLVPARVQEQERAAREIQRRHPMTAANAGTVAMMEEAAQLLLKTMARSGRRISARNTCEELAKSVLPYYHLDDIHGGEILKIMP